MPFIMQLFSQPQCAHTAFNKINDYSWFHYGSTPTVTPSDDMPTIGVLVPTNSQPCWSAVRGLLQLAGGSSSTARRRRATWSWIVRSIVPQNLAFYDHTAWTRRWHLLHHQPHRWWFRGFLCSQDRCVNCCELVDRHTCICYFAGYKQATSQKYDLTVSNTTLWNWWRAHSTERWLSSVRLIVLWPLMAVAGTDCTCTWCLLDCLHSWSAPVLPDVSLIDQVLILAVWQCCCFITNYNSRLWFVGLC